MILTAGSKSRLFLCYKKKVVPVKEIYFPGKEEIFLLRKQGKYQFYLVEIMVFLGYACNIQR